MLGSFRSQRIDTNLSSERPSLATGQGAEAGQWGGGSLLFPRTTPASSLLCTYHNLPVIYLLVYLLLSGSPLGCKLHEVMNPCVCRAEPDT